MQRIIIHVDMDAFFAAIEQLDNPAFKNRPLVIGADPKGGRGVVSTASYEARRFGIHSAMPVSEAYRRCPEAIFIAPRMNRYAEVSHQIMEILDNFSPLVEPVSIDEAFVDISGTEKLMGCPEETARKIKKEILADTGLTCSIGIASNKSTAKIASDLKKPDGLTICAQGTEKEFLAPLAVGRLWGVGKKTLNHLNGMGIKTIGDLAALQKNVLCEMLGRHGGNLWQMANGIDEREVFADNSRSSISEEITFDSDVSDDCIVENAISKICDTVSRNMRKEKLRCRTVSIKIRVTGFETFTRSITIKYYASDFCEIRDYALNLFREFNSKGKKIRLIGVKLSNFAGNLIKEEKQLDLFDKPDDNKIREKKESFELLLDALKDKYGNHVERASRIKRPPAVK